MTTSIAATALSPPMTSFIGAASGRVSVGEE
jgi:hypothetical protein